MIVPKTLGNIIYESLKDEIILLKIRPGEKLSETRLADKFNVSRAPGYKGTR